MTRCGCFHFSRMSRFASHVLNDAGEAFSFTELFNCARFVFNRLPHTRIVSLFVCITIDFDLEAVRVFLVEDIALTKDASFALFQITRSPRGVKMMFGDQARLYIHTSPHFDRWPNQETDFAAPHLLE